MDKDRIIERLKYVMGKNDVLVLADYFTKMENGVSILFNLCDNEDEKLSFHAAWVLENVLLKNQDLLVESIPILIGKTPTLKNPSTIRHFCKLLNYALESNHRKSLPRKSKKFIENSDLEPITESCFGWLLDTNIKPAVKAHCMDILYYLSFRYDWIRNELPYVLELVLLDASPGIKNKALKILDQLRKNDIN